MAENEIRDAISQLVRQREEIDETIARLKAELKECQQPKMEYAATPAEMFYYTISQDSAVIRGYYGFDDEKTLVIPEKIQGVPVVAIHNGAFKNLGFETITIPDTVTIIGYQVFAGCVHLKKIVLSSRVHSIEREAFYGCIGLKSLSLPDSVRIIKERAFYGCSNLSELYLNYGVEVLGEECFCNTALRCVRIPGTIKIIPKSCFRCCNVLRRVILESGTEKLSADSFLGSSSVINIPDTMKNILLEAFISPYNNGTYKSGFTTILVEGMDTGIEKPGLPSGAILPVANLVIYCRPGSKIQQEARSMNIKVKPLNSYSEY